MKQKNYKYDDCISKTQLIKDYGRKLYDAYAKRHKVDYTYENKYGNTCVMYAMEKVKKYVETHTDLSKKCVTYKKHILMTDGAGNELVSKYKSDITMTLLDGQKIGGSKYLFRVFGDDIKKFYVANYITYFRHNKTEYDVELRELNDRRDDSWKLNRHYIHHPFDYDYAEGDFESVEEFNEYWDCEYMKIKNKFNHLTKVRLVEDYNDEFFKIGIDVAKIVNELN